MPLQIHCLFYRRLPSQNRIPTWKPPKSPDDIHMLPGKPYTGRRRLLPSRPFFPSKRHTLIASDRRDLTEQILIVHQRRIEERLLHGLYRPIKPFGDGLHGDIYGLGVRGECVRGITVDVAGELVEEDEQREGALRGFGPAIKG